MQTNDELWENIVNKLAENAYFDCAAKSNFKRSKDIEDAEKKLTAFIDRELKDLGHTEKLHLKSSISEVNIAYDYQYFIAGFKKAMEIMNGR